jgi:hypothetical protein
MLDMHTVILPYFSDPEINRYERILAHMEKLGPQRVPFEFLLASSPATSPSERLYQAAKRIAPTRLFECPTQVFGYPAGCSAMFWDCMWHVANDPDSSRDFVMWFESDMCPVKPNWLDRLSDDWAACGDIYAMGYVIPDIDRERRKKFAPWKAKKKKRWVSLHVNGGACYRRDLIRHVAPEHRAGIFDIEIGKMLASEGGFADCPGIVLTTTERLSRDLKDEQTLIVHGYLQDKDVFLDMCFADLVSDDSQKQQSSVSNSKNESRVPHPSSALFNAILRTKDLTQRTLAVTERRIHEVPQKQGTKANIDPKFLQMQRQVRRSA